jgi:hypothetical protein
VTRAVSLTDVTIRLRRPERPGSAVPRVARRVSPGRLLERGLPVRHVAGDRARPCDRPGLARDVRRRARLGAVHPDRDGAHVYDTMLAASDGLGMRHAGYHALNSLRIEKAYRHMGHDITDEETPLEAGLGFAVAWDKPGASSAAMRCCAGGRRASAGGWSPSPWMTRRRCSTTTSRSGATGRSSARPRQAGTDTRWGGRSASAMSKPARRARRRPSGSRRAATSSRSRPSGSALRPLRARVADVEDLEQHHRRERHGSRTLQGRP